MFSCVLRRCLVLVLAVMLLGACGDDTAATTTAPTVTTVPGPTTTGTPSLRLTVEDLTGAQGKIVLGSLFGGTGPVGTVCLPVDADPWTGSGIFTTSDPANPCGKDAPYGQVIAENGEYSLGIGVFTPGETSASACLDTTVVIAGPSDLTIAGRDLATECTG